MYTLAVGQISAGRRHSLLLDETGDNIHIFLSTTISILSLEHYGPLLSWIDDQRYNKIRDTVSHLVYNPKYFNIGLLDNDQLCRTIDTSKLAVAQRLPLLKKIDRHQAMYAQIKIPNDTIAEQRLYFLRAWDNLQKNQKQDWNAIFPMAALVADEWRAI